MLVSGLIGFTLSLLVAYVSYKRHRLDKSGFIGATLLGTIVFTFGNIIFYVMMMLFFFSSTFISHMSRLLLPSTHYLMDKKVKKHEARTIIQVFANGGVLGVLSILYYFSVEPYIILLASISMAASTADTWAGEIGIFSHQATKSIITRQPIVRGLSGGVTNLGFIASLAGSTLITLVSLIYALFTHIWQPYLLIALILSISLGFLGSIVDSALGELVQAKYLSLDGIMITEHPMEDQHKLKLLSGVSLIDNNMVNLLSNVIVVLIGYGIILLMRL
ncbi:MAG: DUF92 domain-containing protein [Erysipelotrichaceae bacterium]